MAEMMIKYVVDAREILIWTMGETTADILQIPLKHTDTYKNPSYRLNKKAQKQILKKLVGNL